MQELELQCDVVGARWVQSQHCWRISLDVKEIEQLKYKRIPDLIDLPFTVKFLPAKGGTGRRDGKPPEAITEGQRKMLWIIFSHKTIQTFYGVGTKEEAEQKYKERMKIKHLSEATKDMVSASIDAMQKEIRKTDPNWKCSEKSS